MQDTYLDVTEEAGRAFSMRRISGPVVMLNLLRFRAQADYSATPHLAGAEPIDGAAAYQRYIDHTLPLLRRSGGDVVFLGRVGRLSWMVAATACSSVGAGCGARLTSCGASSESCCTSLEVPGGTFYRRIRTSATVRPTRPTQRQ